MASYLIMTPPGEADPDHRRTWFVRDGFSPLGFLFPVVWLLLNRYWLTAIAALLLEAIGVALCGQAGFLPGGLLLILGVRLLVGLECHMLQARRLALRGWRESGLVAARSASEAEDIYFASLPEIVEQDMPKANWDIRHESTRPASGGPALGLIGYEGHR